MLNKLYVKVTNEITSLKVRSLNCIENTLSFQMAWVILGYFNAYILNGHFLDQLHAF